MGLNKPVVGIYADYPMRPETDGAQIGTNFKYYNFAIELGWLPVMLTAVDAKHRMGHLLETIDILMIPGGADVDPSRYNEAPIADTGRVNAHFEYLDKTLAKAFIEKGKMVVGICRGMQSLNVMFGGSLFQHIRGHNQMYFKNASRSDTEQVLFVPETNETFLINSIHHQAVKKLGDDLEPIGYTSAFRKCPSLKTGKNILIDGNLYLDSLSKLLGGKEASSYKGAKYSGFIEAFKHKNLPIIAFQYHPEEFDCEFAMREIKKVYVAYTNGQYKNKAENFQLKS